MKNFFITRLGKASVEDIRRIDSQIKSPDAPFELVISCKQVPVEASQGDYVFIWLGSDNNQGTETEWLKGVRAFGKIATKSGGPSYTDEWQITVAIGVVLPKSVTHDDFLAKSATAYYWFSRIPVVGINTHSNQTFQPIKASDPKQDVRALVYAIANVYPGFKADIFKCYPELSGLFNYVPSTPSQGHQLSSSLLPPESIETTASAQTAKLAYLPADWILALAAKGFLLVSGPSGTGKSRVGREIAIALDYLLDGRYSASQNAASPANNLAFIPVGADWTDDTHLLGYHNFFGAPRKQTTSDGTVETTNEIWEVTPTLRLILRAIDKPDTPHFLILDEMNLSHVERYFSKFLSILEANRGLADTNRFNLLSSDETQLVAQSMSSGQYPLEHEISHKLAASGRGIPLPDNLFVIGTVNVDETTYMFSPKVLDRAHVIEMTPPEPKAYLNSSLTHTESLLKVEKAFDILRESILRKRSGYWERESQVAVIHFAAEETFWKSDIDEIISALENVLGGMQKLLEPVGFGFAFRSINEVCSYLATYIECNDVALFTTSGYIGWQVALDKAIFQKILPKLHGNRRQLHECLIALKAFLLGECCSYNIGQHNITIIPGEETGFKMRQSALKIEQMLIRLEATGYTTFVC